mmetsp:Transcript_1078/g.1733  ORF Transcript_1078/g.1733 Transcript_1078/m.1733 type:complete len:400 (+) Transcript_1078:1-1200(+)
MMAKNEVDRCKSYLNRVLQMDVEFTPSMLYDIAPVSGSFMREALLRLGNPRKTLDKMHELINRLCDDIKRRCDLVAIDKSASPPLYLNETYSLMLDRWEKINKDFYRVKDAQYDLTKVPEVYDMARYDVLHNYHLEIDFLEDLFRLAELFADCVVPQEYGVDETEKRGIGVKMCSALMSKIQYDLNVAKSGTQMDMEYLLDLSHGDDLRIRTLGRSVRTRLYFTSESHLYTLLNVLTYPPHGQKSVFSDEGREVIDRLKELSYLSQISIRLFDKRSRSTDDPLKYRCEISFSPGATGDPTVDKTGGLADRVLLNKSIPCDDLISCLTYALSESEGTRSASTDGGANSLASADYIVRGLSPSLSATPSHGENRSRIVLTTPGTTPTKRSQFDDINSAHNF